MAFGPELLVVRDGYVEDKAEQVRLGEFDPETFPSLPIDDPARRFMDSVLVRFLTQKDSAGRFMSRRISDPDCILWGVIDDDQTVGFASLSLDDQDRNFCTYTIILHPCVRGRGLGGLATAGVVQKALEYDALHSVSAQFDRSMSGIGTAIHPQNRVSQTMCEQAGFELKDEHHFINGVNFLSYFCDRPARQPVTILPV